MHSLKSRTPLEQSQSQRLALKSNCKPPLRQIDMEKIPQPFTRGTVHWPRNGVSDVAMPTSVIFFNIYVTNGFLSLSFDQRRFTEAAAQFMVGALCAK